LPIMVGGLDKAEERGVLFLQKREAPPGKRGSSQRNFEKEFRAEEKKSGSGVYLTGGGGNISSWVRGGWGRTRGARVPRCGGGGVPVRSGRAPLIKRGWKRRPPPKTDFKKKRLRLAKGNSDPRQRGISSLRIQKREDSACEEGKNPPSGRVPPIGRNHHPVRKGRRRRARARREAYM